MDEVMTLYELLTFKYVMLFMFISTNQGDKRICYEKT